MFNLTVLLFYMGVLVVITSVLSLRTHDPDPMLGGRNMPWWLVGASIVGTNLSSVAFLVIPVIGYTMDMPLAIGNLLSPVEAVIVCIFFVKFLRKTRDASIYTLLKERFGLGVSLYASACFIAYSILRAGLILFLVGQALHFVSGADTGGTILICGLTVIFYTYMTGIEGVMWTDLFQTILLALAALLALFFIGGELLHSFPDASLAWAGIRSIISEGMAGEGSVTKSLGGIALCFFIINGIAVFTSDQSYAQRYLVARSDSHAQRGLLASGICIPLIVGMFIAIGMGLFVYYKMHPGLLPSNLSNDQVFAYFIANNFPNGLLGLAIVGVLAAAMSSIDTGINSSSTVFYCNFWELFARKSESNVLHNMDVMRKCSLFFGMIAIVAAFVIYHRSESIVDVWLKSGSLMMSGLLGLFVLMRISKRVGKKSGTIALVCGMAFLFWATLSKNISFLPTAPFHYMWGLPMSTLIMVVVGLVASRCIRETAHEESAPFIYSEEARRSIARKRKRAKKNMFVDSLRPKPAFQLYAGIGVLCIWFIRNDGSVLGVENVELGFLVLSAVCLILVLLSPFVFENFTSKRYLLMNLVLLTLALPFPASATMFANAGEPIYGYLFLIAIAYMGMMVGWTMLGIGVMAGTCMGSVWAMAFYPSARSPDNWMLIMVGALAAFIYFAMDAAKEKMFAEKYLGKVSVIAGKISDRMTKHLLDLNKAGYGLKMTELAQINRGAEDIAQTVKALRGATNIDPEEGQMELSVLATLRDAIKRVSLASKKNLDGCISILSQTDDFLVLGSREIFENILYQVLDNGAYYLERGEASKIECEVDSAARVIVIRNDGPVIEPKHVPYIFDIAYTTKKDAGMGLGLTYAKKMLEGMRAVIRLSSKPHQDKVEFKIYFPLSYDGRRLPNPEPLEDGVQEPMLDDL